MPPAARIGDMHVCPLVTGTVPHVGGPIAAGCPTVMIGSMPAARVGDLAICTGPPDAIAMGSMSVLIGGMPAARQGDMTVHGGAIAVGFPTVMIGDVGSGSGLPPRLGAALSQALSVPNPADSPQSSALKDAAAEATPLVEKCPYADH